MYHFSHFIQYFVKFDVFSSVQLAHILPAVTSIDPCAQQQKLVKLVLPVENLMYSSVDLDGPAT